MDPSHPIPPSSGKSLPVREAADGRAAVPDKDASEKFKRLFAAGGRKETGGGFGAADSPAVLPSKRAVLPEGVNNIAGACGEGEGIHDPRDERIVSSASDDRQNFRGVRDDGDARKAPEGAPDDRNMQTVRNTPDNKPLQNKMGVQASRSVSGGDSGLATGKKSVMKTASRNEGGAVNGMSQMFREAAGALSKGAEAGVAAAITASRRGGAGKTAEGESGDEAVAAAAAAGAGTGGAKAVGTEVASVEQAQPPAGSDSTRCDELVDRMLVSRPAPDGREEVRIRLDRDWLPATEVVMVKTPGAGLSVEFMSDRVESQRFLLPNLTTLRERLADRTGDQVVVRMTEQAGEGEDRDGRSRNRRNIYEEAENDR